MGVSAETNICIHKLQRPGGLGMAEVLTLKTLRFQQSLFIAYLAGAVPPRSRSLGWMGR